MTASMTAWTRAARSAHVLVQRRGADADPIGDGLHRQRVEAALLEELAGGDEDRVAGGAGSGRAHVDRIIGY